MYDHDMFGLDEAGGTQMQYLIGGAAGVGISAAAGILARRYGEANGAVAKYSNAIGAGTSALAGGAMLFFPQTKAVGMATIVSGVAAGLLAHVAGMIEAKAAEPSAYGFGIPMIDPAYPVPGSVSSGFGAPVIDPAFPIPGSVRAGLGAARPELVGPPTLVGAGDYGLGQNPAVTQTKLLGGPSISALGAHYGATLFGG